MMNGLKICFWIPVRVEDGKIRVTIFLKRTTCEPEVLVEGEREREGGR